MSYGPGAGGEGGVKHLPSYPLPKQTAKPEKNKIV